MYDGVERRRYPRLNRSFLVHYPVADGESQLDLSQVKNISLGGVLFLTTRPYEKESNIPLRIKLPGAYVEPQARVIESRQIEGGSFFDTRLEFLPMEQFDREHIAQVLQHYIEGASG